MGSTPLTPAMDMHGERSMKEAFIFLVFSSFAKQICYTPYLEYTPYLHTISGNINS